MAIVYHAYLPPFKLTPLNEIVSRNAHIKLYSVPLYGDAQPSKSDRSQESLPERLPLESSLVSDSVATASTSTSSEGLRRSKRHRTTGSLLGTLPQIDVEHTESLLSSLNTTASFPAPTAGPSSSLVNLPKWTLPLSKLTSLSTLFSATTTTRKRTRASLNAGQRQHVSVLCCVMAVEPPVLRFRKEDRGNGKEPSLWISSWSVATPAERKGADPVNCTVKLWDTCAREWGGMVRKGDVLLIQDAEFKQATRGEPAHLVLSNSSTTSPTILYRTLPRYGPALRADYVYQRKNMRAVAGAASKTERGSIIDEDRALRPDMRLERSDPGVRRVAEMTRWCAEWVGGEGPK